MVTLKVLKLKLDSSNIFYGVLRVVKMTSLAKFNDIIKHAKVRDLSLRIPIQLFRPIAGHVVSLIYLGIMSNSGKCGSINVNIMECISSILTQSVRIMTYGKKGYSLCNKFSGFIQSIYEPGSTSTRNLLISSRILSSMMITDNSYSILYNRYNNMTSRVTSYYILPSYECINNYSAEFIKEVGLRRKYIILNGSGSLVNVYNFLYSCVILNCLFENDLSECSARIQSLETALKNLKSIIEELQKIYNKRRQGAITSELLEVIASTISI